MKRIIAVFLTLIFCSSFISISFVNSTGIVLHYLSHINQITAKFCVNTDKPALHCNGMCHMRKQLQKEHQEHKNHAEDSYLFGRQDINLFCAQIIEVSFLEVRPQSPVFPPYQTKTLTGYFTPIFHPPISWV